METKEVTYHVKFVAECEDEMGYANYVFERLEYDNLDYKDIMCVRFPNWNQCSMKLGDVGYVSLRYVEEGIDKWYDGTDLVPYKETNIIFLKFIHEKPSLECGQILLD